MCYFTETRCRMSKLHNTQRVRLSDVSTYCVHISRHLALAYNGMYLRGLLLHSGVHWTVGHSPIRGAIKKFLAWPSSVQNKIKIVFASYRSKAQNTTCTIWLLGYKCFVHFSVRRLSAFDNSRKGWPYLVYKRHQSYTLSTLTSPTYPLYSVYAATWQRTFIHPTYMYLPAL